MEVLFILIIVGAIIAIAVSKHSKALNEVWAEAAHRLDLRFQSGSHKALRGSRPAMQLLVQTKNVGKSQWTEYIATFKNALPIQLKLSPQGFFSEVTNSLFSRVDIEIGDASFDSGILVEGADPAQVREFLDTEVVHAIKRLVARFDQFEIDHRGVTVLRSRVANTVDLLTEDVELLEKISLFLIHKANAGKEQESMETEKIPVPPPVPDRETPHPPPLPKHEEEETEQEEAIPAFEEVEEEVVEEPAPEPVVEEVIEEEIEEEPVVEEPIEISSPVVAQWVEGFSEATSRYEFSKTFDTFWKDQEVAGEAQLKAVETFSMDRVFGRGPGHRLIFDLGRLENGERLQLVTNAPPESETKDLRSRIGKKVSFEGTLIRCDAFTRTLFLQVPVLEPASEET